MKFSLTVGEASQYSDAKNECVGTPHSGGCTTQRNGRPLTGLRCGHGDDC